MLYPYQIFFRTELTILKQRIIMKQFFLMAVATFAIAAGGRKDNIISPPQQPTVQLDDARTVLLREVVAQSLPNPYFHFIYDSMQYVKQISFASGFNVYNVEYENKRVKKMTSSNNGNFLLYSYHNNQVSEINEFSGLTGNRIYTYRFFYNCNQQLTQVLWFDYFNDCNSNLFKKSELTYQADGNLATIDHFSVSAGQVSWVKTIQFSNYDDKTNVDDFYLLEDFFDTYLFLPQVKLQKNNPLKQQITGPENDFEILYTYRYQNDLPVKKTGVSTQIRGASNGQPVQIANLFNYY